VGWLWSDAWIFAAVAEVWKRRDLERIVATADSLNHAIVTNEELEGAIGRLAAVGLVEVEGTSVGLTSKGRRFWKDNCRGVGLGRFEPLEQALAALPLPEPEPAPWRFPEGAIDGATARYYAQPDG
jgi:hypothetical protein